MGPSFIPETASRRRSLLCCAIALVIAAGALLAGCSTGRRIILSEEESDWTSAQADQFIMAWEQKLSERYFLEGSLLQMRERYGEAITQFEHVLRLTPQSSAVHFAIARCYQALGRLDTALTHAEQALALDTGNLDARIQLADLLVANGRITRAVEQYEEVVRRQPNNLQARYNAARLQQRSSPDRSILHYEYIRRNLGDDYGALLNLGELYMNRRSYDEAAGVLRELLILDAGNPDLYRILTDAYLRGGRYREAEALIDEIEMHIAPDSLMAEVMIEELSRAADRSEARPSPELRSYALAVARRVTERFPKRWEPSFYAGVIHFHLEDSLAADSLIHRALANRSAPLTAWTEAAALYINGGESARALRFLTPTSHRFKNNARVPYLIGYGFFLLSQNDSAEKYLKRSLAIQEDNSEAWGHLGLIYNRQGKPAASENAYEKALYFDPDDQTILNNYAYALAQYGRRLDRAIEMVNRALEKEPDNESFLDTKGWIYYKLEDYQRALQYIQRSVDIGGAGWEVLEHLGDTQQALGNLPAARDAYERALKLSPGNKELMKKYDAVK